MPLEVKCFPCSHTSEKPYDYHALAMFAHWDKLCDACLEKLKATKPPAEKYILKAQTPVSQQSTPIKQWTPKQIEVPKDYTEREAGEEG